MELLEAIRTRNSVRAFRPDPVPRKVLEELLETCIRAPSWANSQPWEFAILGGKAMEELKKKMVAKAEAEVPPNPDLPRPNFGSAWEERSRQNGRRLFEVLGIGRDDARKRLEWSVRQVQSFGAPNGIIFYLDRSLGSYSILDTGNLMTTIMLAAQAYGLGTCPQAALVRYPDVLREVLKIPETKCIVCGMAIGYPDPQAPVNKFRSHREPLSTFATWHGF